VHPVASFTVTSLCRFLSMIYTGSLMFLPPPSSLFPYYDPSDDPSPLLQTARDMRFELWRSALSCC